MNDLIQNLTSQLGVSAEQAQGGVGAIVKLAQEKLSGDDFSTLTSKIPELADMLTKAPSTGSAEGLGSMVSSALSAFGADSAGNLASLTDSFSQLGLSPEMIAKFAPIVTKYVQDNGGDIAQNLIKKLF
ncbi:MAG: DUF2780 domain-containing protein [Bdellovibrionales bacterium]|nr:DUF2780 domain-containing protein [Bdellovibrionales bacterium]